jgi:hypothetical protein
MANILLQNSTYFKVENTTGVGISTDYDVIPFDINNNLISEITVNVDSTNGPVSIYLPEISTLPNYNLKITVVATTVVGGIRVYSSGSDLIGSLTNVTLTANKSIECSPVESINWYGVVTA